MSSFLHCCLKWFCWLLCLWFTNGVPGQVEHSEIHRAALEPFVSRMVQLDTTHNEPFSHLKAIAQHNAVDAQLNAISVLSSDRLCAVGDSGTILLSKNAGRSWERVESGTTDHLHGVHFFDGQRGVAVGGSIGNYTGTSRGVVLQTLDGGLNWKSLLTDLPALDGLIYDANLGILLAWGNYDYQRTTSVFISSDRGGSWHSSGLSIGNAAAASISPSHGILAVDSRGHTAYRLLQPQGRVPAETTQAGHIQVPHTAHRLHHTGKEWLAIGDHGLLVSSGDGQKWQPLSIPLSKFAQELCDWHFVSQRENEIWIGGNPGSVLLYSPDGGNKWQVRHTGFTLPLRDIRFLDRQRGWAVGAGGRILATRDGGQNWYEQRRRDGRAGLLALSDSNSRIAWPVLVASAWESRASTVALIGRDPLRSETRPASVASDQQRLCAARSMGIGATQASFRDQDGHLSVPRMAVLLATWKPSVVCASEELAIPISALLSEDGEKHRPELGELGLQTWHIEKLVTHTDAQSAEYSEHSQRVLRTLGLSLWDLMVVLPPAELHDQAAIHLQTQWARTKNRAAQASLMGAIPVGTDILRSFPTDSLGNYQLVMGRIHRRQSLEQLMRPTPAATDWASSVDFVLTNFPRHEIAPTIYDLIRQNRQPGKWHAATWAREEALLWKLIQLQGKSDAGLWAMLELLQMKASDELHAWRLGIDHSHKASPPVQSAVVANSADNVVSASHVDRSRQPASAVVHATGKVPSTSGNILTDSPWNSTPFSGQGDHEVVSASAAIPVKKPEVIRPRADHTTAWFALYDQFSRLEPRLHSRPDMQLMVYRMSQRSPQRSTTAGHRLDELLAKGVPAGWRQIATQELQLTHNHLQPTSLLALTAPTANRPKLDGQLDEPMWRAVPSTKMTSVDASMPGSQIHFAADEQYLYIALQCVRQAKSARPRERRTREYDADLGALDHVQISLDTDRDYNSRILLGVAEDGGTFDRCLDYVDFNPKWHVCVANQDTSWTAEIAIEHSNLTSTTDLVGSAWSLHVRHLVAGELREYWGHDAATQSPISGGLLLFVPPRASTASQP